MAHSSAMTAALVLAFSFALMAPAQTSTDDPHDESHGAPAQKSDREIRAALNEQMLSLERDRKLRPFASLAWTPRTALPALQEPNETPLAGPDLFERVADATLMVHAGYKCDRCSNWHGIVASGFVVHPDGWIVTAAHVVNDLDDTKYLTVMERDGDVAPVSGVYAVDESRDLAILRIEASGLAALSLAEANPPPGAPVSVVSHPQNHFFVLTDGVVSRVLGGKEDEDERLQVTAGIATGSSGAPVVDDRGNVVGVALSTVTLYADRDDHDNPQLVLNNCVPVESIHELIREERAKAESPSDSDDRNAGVIRTAAEKRAGLAD